jgi:anti-sigma B factor antagonist
LPLHIQFDGDIAILSNLGRLMNDPRYFDAVNQVDELLSEGFRAFVIELRGVGETGSPLLGLMMTMTRQIRRRRGEVVLVGVSRNMDKFLDEMRMEEFWDVFDSIRAAKELLVRHDDVQRAR